MNTTVEVLGVPIFNGTSAEAAAHIVATCMSGTAKANRFVSATGAHGIVTAKKDPAFRSVLEEAYLNLPDGMPTVWIGRMKGSTRMERCYGPEVFERVIKESAHSSVKHFLCGGKDGIALALAEVCRTQLGNSQCVGTYSPPFRALTSPELADLAREINSTKTDIVWIGLSTPKQEVFARELAKHIQVHFIITVGAAFDFHVGAVRQAPKLIQRMGLEWAFRLATEPARLFRRYLEIVPLFIIYGIRDLASFHRH